MNILINLSTLKAGGGQNVVLNFVSYLIDHPEITYDHLFFSVAKGSVIHQRLSNSLYKDDLILCSTNPIIRIINEILFSPGYCKRKGIDVIYSYFGWGFYPKKYPQITGCAASNLYYPEIDFWEHYHGIGRLKKKIIDRFRVLGLKRSNGIIFETDLLEKKFHEIFGFNALTRVIKPSIAIIQETTTPIQLKVQDRKCGLFLCGWQLNKNILLIPEIAAELKRRNIEFVFIITAAKNKSQECCMFFDKVERFQVHNYIQTIGTVNKGQLSSLYRQIDLVFLLSKLESFSNNIIEAWTFGKPLVISDASWARDICKGGAIYVNRDSVTQIADVIQFYINGYDYSEVVKQGQDVLATYPSIAQRTQQELSFIKEVYEENC